MSRFRAVFVLLVTLLILVTPACGFSTFGDGSPLTASAQSAGATATQTENRTTQTVSSPWPVVFTGKVSNRSGGEVPADLPIKLQGFQDMTEILLQTAAVGAGGIFEFPPLDVAAGQMFVLSVEYKGIVFSSGMIDAASLVSANTWPVELEIFENSTSLDGVYIDLCHIFISSLSAEKIRVVVYLLLSNDTKNVIAAPDGEPVIHFSIPEDADNLQLDDSGLDSRFSIDENGFGDTLYILPGAQVNEILFSYELPYDGNRDLSFVFPVPDQTGTLIVPEGIRIIGDDLVDAGERDMDGEIVQLYSFSFLPADDPLDIQLSGREKGISWISSTEIALLGLGVFILVMALVIVWLGKRSRRNRKITEPASQSSCLQTQEAILDAIISLDREHDEGLLAEEEYVLRRDELKTSLRNIRRK